MTARVFGVQFSADVERTMDVRVSSSVTYTGRTGNPKAADFPPDLVAALHTWSAPPQEGVHEDYRVPLQLVEYLNHLIQDKSETVPAASARNIARVIQHMLELGPDKPGPTFVAGV